jgi:hypothetical protein
MHDEDMWNEVPQMIMNKMMKETMADKLMMEEALMDETMDEKLMMDKGLLINEESMDYDQSIMDEMMGWHRITPAMNQQPGNLTTPLWISRSMRSGSSAFTPRRWSTDSTIICDITTVDQRTGPRYEALSYEWGSPSSKEYTIQLNRRSIPVRHNLWCALYELQDAPESRTLWIDALCIYFDRYRTEYRRNLRFRPCFLRDFVLR